MSLKYGQINLSSTSVHRTRDRPEFTEVTDQCSHHQTDLCSQVKWQTGAHITGQTCVHRRGDRPVLTSQDRPELTGEVTDHCSHQKTDPSSQEKRQTGAHITRQTGAHRRSDRPVFTSQDRQALTSQVTGQAVIQVCGGNDNDQTDDIHKQAGTELQGMWKIQTHSWQFALSFPYVYVQSAAPGMTVCFVISIGIYVQSLAPSLSSASIWDLAFANRQQN